MAYLGNRPAESFASFEKQVFTIVNSQTAYTLSHSVVNENDIRLVVNSVVQEPGSGKAYTASGTTLTLSAALTNGTDTMYCVFLGRALQTVNAPNASVGTAQLASEAVTNAKVASTIITGQTAETSIATDDLILLSDTSASGALKKMTQANFLSGVGGSNTPTWIVERTSNLSINQNAETQVVFNGEIVDSASAYDTSTGYFTCPSGQAGTYWVGGGVEFSGSTGEAHIGYRIENGSGSVVTSTYSAGDTWLNFATERSVYMSKLVYLPVGFKVSMRLYTNSSGIQITARSHFQGFKLIGTSGQI